MFAGLRSSVGTEAPWAKRHFESRNKATHRLRYERYKRIKSQRQLDLQPGQLSKLKGSVIYMESASGGDYAALLEYWDTVGVESDFRWGERGSEVCDLLGDFEHNSGVLPPSTKFYWAPITCQALFQVLMIQQKYIYKKNPTFWNLVGEVPHKED